MTLITSSQNRGSKSWKAPELQLPHETNAPKRTAATDVYAFASLCLEVRLDSRLGFRFTAD
jgi:hypothetical protein